MSKVASLHGTKPAEIFQSGLENLDQIQDVAVSVLWKNGSVTAGWSTNDTAKLAFMILALDEEQRRQNLRQESA